jgi:potassium channel subfamily K
MAGPVSVFAIERRITDESENDPTCRRLEALERGDDVDENAQGEEFAGQEEEAELREMGEEDAAYDADLRARLADISRRRSNEGATRRSWQNQGNGTRETDYAQERNNSSVVFDEDDITTLRQDGSRTMGRNVTIDEPICDSMEKTSGDATDDAPQPMSYPYQTRRRFRRISAGFSSAMTSTDRSLASFSAVVSESWDRRHDPKHKGFWDALWRWLMGAKVDANAGQQEGDPDYVPPKYRWTPILSGLLQPFSILLEIPGLTEHWYVRTENNIPVVYQENPVILDVGLAISMACGVVANVALISRFLERRVFTSTIACIVMLTCHDIINIVIVTIFGVIHDVNDGFNYSEAFWLCVCSTVASMFTNITLIYDLVKTKDFARSGSGLTPKQRKLVIIVMILLVYIALGALCFNFLLPNIAFQNALYYTVVSIETIGFGDISPSTLGAKIFLFFYVPVGILNLAVAVGTARDTLVESWSTAYRRRRHEMIKRHRLRKQQRIEENIRRMAIEKQLLMVGAPVYVSTKSGGVRGGAKGKKLNIRALSKDQLDEAENAAINEIAKQGGTGSARSAIRAVPDVGTQGYEKAVEDVRKMQDELTQQSLLSEEGYREFQEKLAHEEKMENLFKVSEARWRVRADCASSLLLLVCSWFSG